HSLRRIWQKLEQSLAKETKLTGYKGLFKGRSFEYQRWKTGPQETDETLGCIFANYFSLSYCLWM
ncbi:hypothetical protein ACQP3C_28080, partial [Escherichia coli]